MKHKTSAVFIMLGLIMLMFIGISKPVVFADNENAVVIENDDYRLQNDYLDFYSVPTKEFTYVGNGGELSGNELSKAFDRNFTTSFKSAQDNNVSYTDPETNETKPNFINIIDVTFSQKVTLNRIIYAPENGTARGYPTELNLYYDSGAGFTLIRNYKTTETAKFVVFDFGQNITMGKFRFEYVKVSTNYKYVATAKEIIFLQPETDDFNLYENMFADYSQTTLIESLNTFDKLSAFEEKLKSNINYSSMLEKFDRAKAVVIGKVNFNPKREFSTDQTAQNVIFQYGDIASYCQNDLQMSSFGTNRQVTGILSNAGQEINIYVDALDGDPLPKIRFSQHVGSWRKWLGGELQLKRGKNTFTTPNFKHTDYTIDVALGGSIYLVNPYTSTQQSSNVKVYIEGGSFYPVLNKNTNESEYRHELYEYSKLVNENPSTVVNLTEIVTDHAIITVDATRAYETYKTYSPLLAVENWNNFMDQLLNFGGVSQDPTSPVFNEKNLHANFNIRLVQPWPGAGAFAYTEHVGVYSSWQGSLLLGKGFGWGVPHEIGHMMDNKNRTIGETSNNMWAKYNETVIEQLNARGEFSKTTETLSSDLNYNSVDYFNSNRYNFLIWWYIECWQKGFWGNLENCYRGTYPRIQEFWNEYPDLKTIVGNMSRTELQVFYASVVTGVDMSYYFDRWGYSLTNGENDPVFKIATASETFNNFMSKAKLGGFADDSKQYKLWYQTNMAYHNTNTSPVYSDSTIVSIKSVTKANNGYNVLINHTLNANHLGYEIWQGDDTNGYKVVGFTYGSSFLDTTIYADGYVPKYKVVAIDNTFNTSRQSDAKSVVENTDIVATINEIGYTTLADAVKNAESGDTIKLLKSFSTINVTIDKNLNITIADDVVADVVISRLESGNMITILSGVTLTINGNENYRLVLDGGAFSQNGELLSIAGIVKAEYITLQNNNSSNYGAIVMQSNSKGSTFKNSLIAGNIANTGSAYICDYSNSNAVFENVLFENNTSSENGVIASKGTLTLTNCTVRNNTVKNGTVLNYAGGILYVVGGEVSGNTAEIGAGFHIDGYTSIKGVVIKNNTASVKASGIYYNTTVAVRQLILENCNIISTTTENGDSLIVEGGTVSIVGTTCQGGELSFLGGEITINSNCDITSKIVVKNGVGLILKGGLFSNIENCTIKVIDFISNMQVIAFKNYTANNEDLTKIISANENILFVLNDNKVLATPKAVQITIVVDGESKPYTYNYGDTLNFDFDIPSTKYVNKITDSANNEYTFGDNYVIEKSETLLVQLADKIKVKLIYEDEEKIELLTPYAEFVLPSKKMVQRKIVGWKTSKAFYDVGECVVFGSDTDLVAEYEQLFKLTLKNNDTVIYEDYFEYDTEIDLSKLSLSVSPDYWSLNGDKVSNVITLNNNLTLQAVFNLKDPHAKIVPIISIISACFAGVLLVASLIAYFYFRNKNGD